MIKKSYNKWVVRVDTDIAGIGSEQTALENKLFEKAYRAGFKRAKEIYYRKPIMHDLYMPI